MDQQIDADISSHNNTMGGLDWDVPSGAELSPRYRGPPETLAEHGEAIATYLGQHDWWRVLLMILILFGVVLVARRSRKT